MSVRKHEWWHGLIGAALLVLMVAVVSTLLGGCAAAPEPETIVEVERVSVPVLVKPEPPPSLLAPLVEDPPQIFSPATAEDVRWGVTPEGMREFRLLIEALAGRLEQWRAWAQEPVDDNEQD